MKHTCNPFDGSLKCRACAESVPPTTIDFDANSTYEPHGRDRCGDECLGYSCTLPKGHAGRYSQEPDASWATAGAFDRCECSGKGTCIFCREKKLRAAARRLVDHMLGSETYPAKYEGALRSLVCELQQALEKP